MFIYGDIVVELLRILSTKSTIYKKNENRKNLKIVFHRFQNIAHLFGSKT